MSAKLANLGLLKIKVFWSKGHDVIISVYDATNKILSCESNYIVEVVMWPKFGNSSISMSEVIITSILQGYDQKKQSFWGVLFFQVQQFGTDNRYGLEILHQCDKSVKTKKSEGFGG